MLRAVTAGIATAGLVAMTLLGAGAAQASVPPITAVSVAAGPFSVDGITGTGLAAISVHVTDARGVGSCADEAGIAPNQVTAQFRRTSGGTAESAWVYLPRTAGTQTDGTFSTQWRLGSTRSGTWTLVAVMYCFVTPPTWDQQGYSVDPRTIGFTRTVTVTGTHAPTVTVTRSPTVVAYGAPQLVTFTYRDSSGAPLKGRPIVVGEDTQCGLNGNGNAVRTTDSAGRVSLWYRDYLRCVYLANPVDLAHPDLGTFQTATLLLRDFVTKYELFQSVSLQAAASRLRATRPVALSGTVAPNLGTVWLQRAGGSGWTNIASAPVASNGTYSLTLRMPANRAMAMGPHTYRVVAMASAYGMAPTASRCIVITGM